MNCPLVRVFLHKNSAPQPLLRVSADYLMLKKAYSYALLKCKGCSILFHFPSKLFKISSGKGLSKSSGTMNSPAHKP